MLIIRLAAQPPRRRGPLSSNVRPHRTAMQMLESSVSRSKERSLAIARRFEPNTSQGSRVFVENLATLVSSSGALRAESRRSLLAARSPRSGRPSAGGLLAEGGSRERKPDKHLRRCVQANRHKTTRGQSALPCHACARGHSRSLSCGHSGRGALTAGQRARPNPSLERTSTGLALGPRGYSGHHSPRGPSANPAGSAQLKR
jgi:hypothetical protein